LRGRIRSLTTALTDAVGHEGLDSVTYRRITMPILEELGLLRAQVDADANTQQLELVEEAARNVARRDQLLKDIPRLACSIYSGEICSDPVLTEDGQTYSRKGIQGWIDQCRRNGNPITSPNSRIVISSELRDNRYARDLVEQICEHFNVKLSSLA
jgi:hypothetical protein